MVTGILGGGHIQYRIPSNHHLNHQLITWIIKSTLVKAKPPYGKHFNALLVGGFSPTHLKNMRTVKLDHFPKIGDWLVADHSRFACHPHSFFLLKISQICWMFFCRGIVFSKKSHQVENWMNLVTPDLFFKSKPLGSCYITPKKSSKTFGKH